jgi:hypothetical protein
MAEIKRTFAAGRMNKDFDERLVPNGEYRDAQNVQVRTTDNGAAGTVQNIKGNSQVGITNTSNDISSSRCVGSVADEKENTAYFIFASSDVKKTSMQNVSSRTKYMDFILKYDKDGRSQPIFSDVFAIKESYSNAGSPTAAANWVKLTGFGDTSNYKIGMSITIYNNSGAALTEPNTFITKIDPTTISVNKVQSSAIGVGTNATSLLFESPRVLGLKQNSIITGINIIDRLLYFTSDSSEPRQINLDACEEGTVNGELSTENRIRVDGVDGQVNYEVPAEGLIYYIPKQLTVDDVTVIKKAPKTAPSLSLYSSKDSGSNTWEIPSFSGFLGEGFVPVPIGTNGVIDGFPDYISFEAGDLLDFTSQKDGGDKKIVTVRVLSIIAGQMTYKVMAIDPNLQFDDTVWSVTNRNLVDDIFKYKFPRFAFRYKYDNNEYSSFGPWSEIAFIPGTYTLNRKEGYNLSMVNRLSKIEILNTFSDELVLSKNVKAVDILYKSTDSPNVYLVRTLERDTSPEWNSKANITITTEMINQVIPSNQILRAWDNVPRTAKAQEIVGNRLVYGNFTQGYDIPFKPLLSHNVTSRFINDDGSDVEKSIKSMRSYKLGIVYGDRYGRETPVIALGTRDTSTDEVNYSYGYDDGYVSKSLSPRASKFQVTQDWSTPENTFTPPDWMEYVKYYVKENSSEYYNLVADRWYDSGDGNLWLSFPSADRNKIDEDTYLILKKASNSNTSTILDYKYKVLAIENEAPDYIKTSLGIRTPRISAVYSLMTLFDANPETWPTTPYTVPVDGTILNLYTSEMNDSPGEFPIGRKIRAVCKVEDTLVGNVTLSTPWVSLAGIEEISDVTTRVYLSEEWGSSAHFVQRLNNMGAYADLTATRNALGVINDAEGTGYVGDNLGIEIQIANLQSNDSAEYQGRFFVKLHRDSGLEYSVVSQAVGSTQYQTRLLNGSSTPVSTGINYIDTNYTTNPATNGTDFNHTWGSVYDIGLNPADLAASCEPSDDKNFWEDYHLLGQGFLDDGQWPGIQRENHMLFLDGARYRTEDGGTISPQALGQTAAANGVFYDQITLSFLERYNTTGGGSMPGLFNSFFQQSITDVFLEVGTIFGFDNDPFDTKYQITNVETETVSNFAADGATCNTCMQGNPDTGGGGGGGGGSGEPPVRSSSWGSARDITDEDDDLPPVTNTESLYCRRVRNVITFVRLDGQGVPEAPGNGIDIDVFDPRGHAKHDGFGALQHAGNNPSIGSDEFIRITAYEFADTLTTYNEIITSTNPAVFETEPKESVDLELYYEASSAIPQRLDKNTTAYFAPVGCRVHAVERNGVRYNLSVRAEVEKTFDSAVKLKTQGGSSEVITGIVTGDIIVFEHSDGTNTRALVSEECFLQSTIETTGSSAPSASNTYANISWSQGVNGETVLQNSGTWDQSAINIGDLVTHVSIPKGSFVVSKNSQANTITIDKAANALGGNNTITIQKNTGFYKLKPEVYKNTVDLPWFNCYSYGNGVESNRIRDDFNAPTIDNGVKVSSTFTGYKEDKTTNRIIYSGIYNANSNTNNLNEFNMAEKITKDLNPDYGSIQAFKTRDTDLITFTEDKVLRVLANKDALFNADGNPNLTATDRVLGQAVPYVGDYGISKNPESLAWDQFRIYFTDKQRGAVLRLSRDGLTPISNVGMREYFRDYLSITDDAIGSFDVVNGEYNLTLKTNGVGRKPNVTISFNETSKGWVSFKSFIQDSGLSVSGQYITANTEKIWLHYSNRFRNTFYGNYQPSTITAIINDMPGTVKHFKTLSYEGSEGKSVNVNNAATTDPETGGSINVNDGLYDSLTSPSDGLGWSASIKTDLQSGLVDDFRDKENKWYGFIIGEYDDDIGHKTLDEGNFTTQGIGKVQAAGDRSAARSKVEITIQN